MKHKAKKFDEGKPRTDLLPPEVVLEVANILGFGAEKYKEDFNYAMGNGLPWRKPYASALRHLFKWASGINEDEETKKNPIDHAIAELMIVSHLIKLGKVEGDNRFVR